MLDSTEMYTGLAESMGKSGWTYHDLPRMTKEQCDQFFEIIGKENIELITWADYGDTQRGQILISPEGMQRGRDYTASLKAADVGG